MNGHKVVSLLLAVYYYCQDRERSVFYSPVYLLLLIYYRISIFPEKEFNSFPNDLRRAPASGVDKGDNKGRGEFFAPLAMALT